MRINVRYFPKHGIPMALLRTVLLIILVMTLAVPGYAASSGNLAVSAYVTSWGACWVTGTQNIAFGNLNPLDPQNVQADGSVSVWCIGIPGSFTVGVTQATPSPLYLTNGSDSIPYTLDLPTSATGRAYRAITIPITARIQGNDYRLAPAGAYMDTVTLEINP
jgi:spore coat protein U-like protein